MGKSADTPAKCYEPTDTELRTIEAYFNRLDDQPPRPTLKTKLHGSVCRISVDHPDQRIGYRLLQSATGASSSEFLDGLLVQMANAASHGAETNDADLNFMLSVVADIEPRDQLEAMLATQMAAVHMATMTFAQRLARVENIPQQDSAEKAFNKLARTFATQMEALKKYRTGGEQKMTVEHVTVNEGGQAIVGNVSQGDGGQKKKSRATP
jgi:hypothetical protein